MSDIAPSCWRRGVRWVVLFLPLLAAVPAAAQPLPEIADSCVGWDHFPASPVGDAPSKAVVHLTVPEEFASWTLLIWMTGASGPQGTEAPVASDGLITAELPLYQYGFHEITELALTDGAGTVDLDPTALGETRTFTVDDSEPECDPDALTRVAATTTTTTTAPATTSIPETTAPATTSPPTTVVPDTTAPPTEEEPGSFTPWILIGVGGMMAIGGAILLLHNPCAELLRAWQAAEARYRTVAQEFEKARTYLEERRARRAEIEAELAELEQAAATGTVTEGGVSYQSLPGEGRVTVEGMQQIIASTRAQLDTAKEIEADATTSLERWRSQMEDTARQAQEAQAAYEACMGKLSPPTVPAAPSGPQGPSVSTGAEEEESGCPEGERQARPRGEPRQFRMCRAFRIETEIEGGSALGDAGQPLIADLTELAAELGVLGALLGGKGAGHSVAGGAAELAGGKIVAGAGGLLRGGIEGVTAAKGNLGTSEFPVPIPTSGPEALVGTLQLVAQLAALVARKADEWVQRRQIYNYRLVREYQTITVRPYEIWVCDGKQWKCDQKVLEYQTGPVQTLRSNPVSGRATSDLDRQRLERELQRLISMGRAAMESSIRALKEYEAQHQPGPCG